MTLGLRAFKLWLESHNENSSTVSITKIKSTNSAWSGISEGESFVGRLAMISADEQNFILFMKDPYMHTSALRDAQQKNPTTWLVKTLNSIYKVKLQDNNA